VFSNFNVCVSNNENHNDSSNGLDTPITPSNQVSNKEKNPEVASTAEQYLSGVRTRTLIESPMIYDSFPNLNSVPGKLEMDFSRILNKPFLVTNISWLVTNPKYGSLTTKITVPSNIVVNALSKIPFNASVYYRAKICLLLQASGTPLHSGTVLASVTPYSTPLPTVGTISNMHNLMSAPHVFLSANQSTAACLEVPFYCTNRLAVCDTEGLGGTTIPSFYGSGNNYAQLNFMVVNPLAVSTGGSNTVSISVHAIFQELEFFVPHNDINFVAMPTAFAAEGLFTKLRTTTSSFIDNSFKGIKEMSGDFFDALRQGIRQYTGLHNPNIPAIDHKVYNVQRNNLNLVDSSTLFEKLDPYADFDRITMESLFMTKQDEMDLSYLLSKPQYITTFRVNSADAPGTFLMSKPITPLMKGAGSETDNLINIISKMSRFWKGSLKLHIQSSMSNFHFCKLLVSLDYSPKTNCLTQQPVYADLQNLMTTALEFSAGGQVQTVDLPFCSNFNQLEVSLDNIVNALQHGLVYVHLMQPLVLSANVPSDVYFNVYLSAGDDFQLYGYSVNKFNKLNVSRVEIMPTFDAESAVNANVPTQEALDIQKHNTNVNNLDTLDLRPIVNIRDFIRRMYPSKPAVFRSDDIEFTNGLAIFPIADLLGINNPDSTAYNPIEVISRLFFGFTGGVKFKFQVYGALDVQAYFVPPGQRGRIGSNFVSKGYPIAKTGSPQFAAANLVLTKSFNPTQGVTHPVPYIESANRSHLLNSWTADPGFFGYEDLMKSSTITLEGQIPNMNPFKFVGNCNQFYDAGSTLQDPAGDLGAIVINITPVKKLRDPNDPNTFTNSGVVIIPHIGLTDEARYGFQTILAPVKSSTIIGTDFVEYTVCPYGSVFPTQPGLPLTNFTTVPGAYYQRT